VGRPLLRSFATVPVLVPQCGPNPEGNAMPSLLPVGVTDVVVVVTLVVDFDVEAVVVVLAVVPEPGTHCE